MADPNHLRVLNDGIEEWNNWRKRFPSVIPNLEGANLEGRVLEKGNFRYTNLCNANLQQAVLDYSIFDNSYLEKTILTGAAIHSATFFNTNLKAADLSGSFLGGTLFGKVDLNNAKLIKTSFLRNVFNSARFDNADLSKAMIDNTSFSRSTFINSEMNRITLEQSIFVDCNLTGTKNLETVIHNAESTIDHRTLAQSTNLPLRFLRGCGLPDLIIDNINVLQNDPIAFYSCFISHSNKDEEFATKLHSDLQDKGIRCWYAPEKMKGGKKIYDQINEAIRIHDKLLLVLSESSMKSEWVITEIKRARSKEKRERKQMLFPIAVVPYNTIKQWELFDTEEGRDLADEIRSYFIPDFSNWKDYDSYKKALEKLVLDLRGENKN